MDITFNNKDLLWEGDFSFQFSSTSNDFILIRNVSFSFPIENFQDSLGFLKEEEAYEIFAEKLKQDFIKTLKEQ